MKREGNIFYTWKGEGYWAYNIFDKNKIKICEIGWSHKKNKWCLFDFNEDYPEGIDSTQLSNIIKLFKKVKKIGD